MTHNKKLFLSAVSSEFSAYREWLAKDLNRPAAWKMVAFRSAKDASERYFRGAKGDIRSREEENLSGFA